MSAVFGNVSELAEFGESFTPKVLFANDRVKVVLAALEPDQDIPLHAPGVDLAVAVLEGTGDLWVGDRAHPVASGDVAVIPAGAARGVRARGGRLALLHVVSPPPTAADHESDRSPWPAGAAGPDVQASLHDEHQELLPHLDHLRALADEALHLDEESLRNRLGGVLGFLTDVLLPHAAVEERALYPAVDRLLRATGGGSRTMSIDHDEIRERIEQLAGIAREPLSETTRPAVARALTQLEAIVRLHFRKEEEAYLPLLSRLSAEEAEELDGALATGDGGHHGEHGSRLATHE
jgi:quercetin dioxygenase-like cupin family protein/hemerythrin-like domain-containing protein